MYPAGGCVQATEKVGDNPCAIERRLAYGGHRSYDTAIPPHEFGKLATHARLE